MRKSILVFGLVLSFLTACAVAQVIHSNDGLIATATASDEDPGDVLTFRFVWQKQVDAVWVDQQDTSDVAAVQNEDGSFTTTDLLTADKTLKNETWRCVVYAYDGELWSDPSSVEVVIRGVGPKIDSLTIEPAP